MISFCKQGGDIVFWLLVGILLMQIVIIASVLSMEKDLKIALEQLEELQNKLVFFKNAIKKNRSNDERI